MLLSVQNPWLQHAASLFHDLQAPFEGRFEVSDNSSLQLFQITLLVSRHDLLVFFLRQPAGFRAR